MKLRLKRISAKDSARLCAFLYALMGLIYVLLGAIVIASGNTQEGIPLIILGVSFPIFGWICVWLMTLIMNWFMKKSGGIEIEFENEK